MIIKEAIQQLEAFAPLTYQETYDNAGLITGDLNWECTGILCSLDATENVIDEAIQLGCNLVVAHHPIVFSGLKKITGKNYVEKTVIKAIKKDIAIYAIHTNLDNVINGVNNKIAQKLGLQNCKVLDSKAGLLKKLFVYVPADHVEAVRSNVFKAGGGDIGKYGECSFNIAGEGTFKPGQSADPYMGTIGKRTTTPEVKVEIVFPAHLQKQVVQAMQDAHPYEEVAYDIISLANDFNQVGSGIIGELTNPQDEKVFLEHIKSAFGLAVIRHTELLNKAVKKVAICGGAGSFLINKAAAAGADFYITGDVKYHEFFDANSKMVIADIGHWESEQFTVDLLVEILQSKFPNFAVLKSKVRTNPVYYFL